MDFCSPLERGRLVSRYKRFFADVRLDDGREVTAHCPNPGAMLGLNDPGLPVWLSRSDDPKRKLAHTLELVEIDQALVGVNTMHPNRIVAEALAGGAIPDLAGYGVVRREVRYGRASRIDFLLEAPDEATSAAHPGPRLWLEVKNVHLMRTAGLAEFPDCVAARSARHLEELTDQIRAGDRAMALFVVQRADCTAFRACRDLDPAFAEALDRAATAGVEVRVYGCEIDLTGVRLAGPMPWIA